VFSAEENAEYKIHGESTRCKISLAIKVHSNRAPKTFATTVHFMGVDPDPSVSNKNQTCANTTTARHFT